MGIEVELKEWGNSLGVILPREVLRKKNLKKKDKFFIEIVKIADFSDVFGVIKKRRMSGQKFKDTSRKEWKK